MLGHGERDREPAYAAALVASRKEYFAMALDMEKSLSAKQREEAGEIQAQIKATGGNFDVKPWDWDFYSEQVRKAKYDLDGAKARQDYARGSAGENLGHFTRTRRSSLALLAGLPPSAGARTAVHSELGTVTLVQLLNEWANHDLGHLRQISELYRARAFHPHSGPFMKYSNPQP